MTIRPVLSWPDPRLRMAAGPVAEIMAEVRDLAADLLETMYAAPGRGLAATQVGAMLRLFVMDNGWREGTPEPVVMVNPRIVAASADTRRMAEGCLSLPGLMVEVERPARIRARWKTLEGGVEEAEFEGIAAACVQHERDHLDGILTIDSLPAEAREELAPVLATIGAGA